MRNCIQLAKMPILSFQEKLNDRTHSSKWTRPYVICQVRFSEPQLAGYANSREYYTLQQHSITLKITQLRPTNIRILKNIVPTFFFESDPKILPCFSAASAFPRCSFAMFSYDTGCFDDVEMTLCGISYVYDMPCAYIVCKNILIAICSTLK